MPILRPPEEREPTPLESYVYDVGEQVQNDALDKDVTSSLAAELDFRLRQVIQDTLKFARHGRRKRASPADVANALKLRNEAPLYGYSSQDPLTFLHDRRGGGLHFLRDETVTLDNFLKSRVPPSPAQPNFSVSWLMCEGKLTSARQVERPAKTRKILRTQAAGQGHVDIELPSPHHLSAEQHKWLQALMVSLETKDQTSRRAICRSLREDMGLSNLLPYVVQNIVKTAKQSYEDLETLRALIDLTDSLLNSHHLLPQLEHYFHQLLPVLLTLMVKGELGRTGEDHWGLRDQAAAVVSIAVDKFGDKYVSVGPRVTKKLIDTFLDRKNRLSTLYGCVVGLMALRTHAIETILVPKLKRTNPWLVPHIQERERAHDAERNDADLQEVFERNGLKMFYNKMGIRTHGQLLEIRSKKTMREIAKKLEMDSGQKESRLQTAKFAQIIREVRSSRERAKQHQLRMVAGALIRAVGRCIRKRFRELQPPAWPPPYVKTVPYPKIPQNEKMGKHGVRLKRLNVRSSCKAALRDPRAVPNRKPKPAPDGLIVAGKQKIAGWALPPEQKAKTTPAVKWHPRKRRVSEAESAAVARAKELDERRARRDTARRERRETGAMAERVRRLQALHGFYGEQVAPYAVAPASRLMWMFL